MVPSLNLAPSSLVHNIWPLELDLGNSYIVPEEFVVSIHQGEQVYRVKPFVIEVLTATISWTSDWALAIQGTDGMQNITSLSKAQLNLLVVIWVC